MNGQIALITILTNDVKRLVDFFQTKGATSIQPPANMPWNQRTAFFADPDGNIHELFADLG